MSLSGACLDSPFQVMVHKSFSLRRVFDAFDGKARDGSPALTTNFLKFGSQSRHLTARITCSGVEIGPAVVEKIFLPIGDWHFPFVGRQKEIF